MEYLNTYRWVKDKKKAFIPYYIKAKTENKFVAQNFETKESKTIDEKSISKSTPANESTLTTNFENLIYLPEFSDASILYQLRTKYSKDKIYTYIGEILISVNPFKNIPFTIEDYTSPTPSIADTDPNIYSLASHIFTKLTTDERSKSVIISGESGAGKTEVNKMILNLVTLMANSSSNIKEKILQSNPILEAFGNAKTGRNENSSRFGKWQELYITSDKTIIGFSLINYLLEKSRIVSPNEGERNYHIFYSLFHDPTLASAHNLKSPLDFAILNSGNMVSSSGWDDSTCLPLITTNLTSFNFQETEINEIKEILIAILYLGNITFELNAEDESSHITDKTTIKKVSELLGTDEEKTEEAITCRIVSILGEETKCPLLPENASKYRDTLSKTIYSFLFDYLFYRINNSENFDKNNSKQFLGTLDIFGFEVFKKNSLEQFYINWTNEKLQNSFNKFIINFEKTSFEKENINVPEIKFLSNKECIALIEGHNSIVSAMNDEVTVPAGNDLQLLQKLKNNFGKNKYFVKSLKDSFIIKHYAENVEYDIGGFVYKNSDKVPEFFKNLLESSTKEIIKKIFKEDLNFVKEHDLSDRDKRKPLLFKFKRSVNALIKRIGECDPFFVKCIKPNDEKKEGIFESGKVLEQLKCAGLNELLRLRKSNFPHRFTFSDFLRRFYLILTNYKFNKDATLDVMKKDCEEILLCLEKEKDFAVGCTKVMLKDNHLKKLDEVKEKKMKIYLQSIIAFCKCVASKIITNKSLLIAKKMSKELEGNDFENLVETVKEADKMGFDFFLVKVSKKALEISKSLQEETYLKLTDLLKFEKDTNIQQRLAKNPLINQCSLILQLNTLLISSSSPESENISDDFLSNLQDQLTSFIQSLTPSEEHNKLTDSNKCINFAKFILDVLKLYKSVNQDLNQYSSLISSLKSETITQFQDHFVYKTVLALKELSSSYTKETKPDFESIEMYSLDLKAALQKHEKAAPFIKQYKIYKDSLIITDLFELVLSNNTEELTKQLDMISESPATSNILSLTNFVIQETKEISSSSNISNLESIKTELQEKLFPTNSQIYLALENKITSITNTKKEENVLPPSLPSLTDTTDITDLTDLTDTENKISQVEIQEDKKIEKLSLDLDAKLSSPSMIRLSTIEVDSTVSTSSSSGDDSRLISSPPQIITESQPPSKPPKSANSVKPEKPAKQKKSVKINKKEEEFIFPIFETITLKELFDYDFPGYVDYSSSSSQLSSSFQFASLPILRTPENFSKKHSLQFLGFNPQIAHLFLTYTPSPIPRSLVKFNARYAGDKHTAKAIKLEAPKLFNLLLQAENMFVNSLEIIASAKLTNYNLNSCKDPRFNSFVGSIKTTIKNLLSLVQRQTLLQDEIFCQLIKQTTKNFNKPSNFFYWAVTLAVVFVVRPSARLAPFLAAHCVRNFRQKGIIRYGTAQELATNVFTVLKEYKEGIRECKMPPFYIFKYTLFKDALYKISLNIYLPFNNSSKEEKPFKLILNQVSGDLVEDLVPRIFCGLISADKSIEKVYQNFTLSLNLSNTPESDNSDNSSKEEEMRNLVGVYNLLVYKKVPFIDILLFIKKETEKMKDVEYKIIFTKNKTVPQDLEIENISHKIPVEFLFFIFKSAKFIYEKDVNFEITDKQIATIAMLNLVGEKKGKRLNSNDILHLDDEELLNLIPRHLRERLEFHSWQSLIFKAATEIKFRRKIVLSKQDLAVELMKVVLKSSVYGLNSFYICFRNASKFKVRTWYILSFNWYVLMIKESTGEVLDRHLLRNVAEVSFDKETHNLQFSIKEKSKIVVSLYCDIEVYEKLNLFRRYIPPTDIL